MEPPGGKRGWEYRNSALNSYHKHLASLASDSLLQLKYFSIQLQADAADLLSKGKGFHIIIEVVMALSLLLLPHQLHFLFHKESSVVMTYKETFYYNPATYLRNVKHNAL